MKFGTLIKLEMLFRMTPRSSKSNLSFKVKIKVKLRSTNDLEFDLKNNA